MTSRSSPITVCAILAMAWLQALAALPQAEPVSTREYQLKAVFILHFTQFVEWPDSLAQTDSSVIIGILGNDHFGPYLEEAVKGETVKGRPIRVERFRNAESAQGCHILFISGSENQNLKKTLDALKNSHVLTIGESQEFSQSGGMIRFATEHSKIRLKINLNAVQGAKLTVSSKLLKLADIVTSEKG